MWFVPLFRGESMIHQLSCHTKNFMVIPCATIFMPPDKFYQLILASICVSWDNLTSSRGSCFKVGNFLWISDSAKCSWMYMLNVGVYLILVFHFLLN